MREVRCKTETLSDKVVLEAAKDHFKVTPAYTDSVEYSREKDIDTPRSGNIEVNTLL